MQKNICMGSLSLFVVLLLWSCQGTKKAYSYDCLKTEYYDAMSSNQERLHNLLQGRFSFYEAYTIMEALENNPKDSALVEKLALYKLDSGDSLFLYSFPCGDINKDGYWMYHTQVFSGLEDEPITQYFEELRRVSRDTFIGEVFLAKNPELFKKAINDRSVLKNFNKEDLIDQNCYMTYVKQDNYTFVGETNYCERYLGSNFPFVRVEMNVSINGLRAKAHYYDKNKEYDNLGDGLLKRLPQEKN